MELISYVKWNTVINPDVMINFVIHNNRCINIRNASVAENINLILVLQYFDVLDEIKILIKKKKNFDLKLIDSVCLNLTNYFKKNIFYKIKNHNVIFSDNDIVIVKFNLKNSIQYKNQNIGGIPMFIFRNYGNFIININGINNIEDYIEKIDLITSGYCILPEYLKHLNNYRNYIPNLLNFFDIISDLTLSNTNNKIDYETNILNYLNIPSYKKKFFNLI